MLEDHTHFLPEAQQLLFLQSLHLHAVDSDTAFLVVLQPIDTRRSKVDFPAPLSPTIPKIQPSGIVTSTSFKICTPSSYVLHKPLIAIILDSPFTFLRPAIRVYQAALKQTL